MKPLKFKSNRVKTEHSDKADFQLHKKCQTSREMLRETTSSKNSRKCSCCENKKYPNYLDEIRSERQKRVSKKKEAQELLEKEMKLKEFSDLNVVDEIPTELMKLQNNISEYEETPGKRKQSLLESFHGSIIKTMGEKEMMKKYLFEVRVEAEGKAYNRFLSTAEFGAQALKEIEQIIAESG